MFSNVRGVPLWWLNRILNVLLGVSVHQSQWCGWNHFLDQWCQNKTLWCWGGASLRTRSNRTLWEKVLSASVGCRPTRHIGARVGCIGWRAFLGLIIVFAHQGFSYDGLQADWVAGCLWSGVAADTYRSCERRGCPIRKWQREGQQKSVRSAAERKAKKQKGSMWLVITKLKKPIGE